MHAAAAINYTENENQKWKLKSTSRDYMSSDDKLLKDIKWNVTRDESFF